MKKRILTAAAFAACLALCAAVWPQQQPAGETPALPTPAVVIATQPEIPEIAEMEEVISPEEEKTEATLPELVEEADIVPEPSPAQTPPEREVQAPSEQDATPQQEPEPAPAPDNMVYGNEAKAIPRIRIYQVSLLTGDALTRSAARKGE